MKILFVHQNMPGQYKHLISHFAANPKYQVACIGESANMVNWPGFKNVRIHGYDHPYANKQETHPLARNFEQQVIRGERVAIAADEIRKSGFEPDVICVHPGWGEGLYLKDIFTKSKILNYCEFYYNSEGSDVGFETDGFSSNDQKIKTRTRNACQLLSLTNADWAISPTHWQKKQYPETFRNKISVIHDGIDTETAKPNKNAFVYSPKAGTLKHGDEVITFISRSLEPYRGFHIFVKAIPLIQKLRPNANIFIVGDDDVGYGPPPPAGVRFRDMFMEPLADKVDISKIHFTGRVPYNDLIQLLQISAAHVYLTYPFVLSWSMLEAMACGCVVIGSKTPPVQEVIEHEKNGILVDFFSPEEIATSIDELLSNKNKILELGKAARKTILAKYDLKTQCLPTQIALIENLVFGKTFSLNDK